MHYYKRDLDDYAKKAGRLSMLEHGAYTLLIDACYDREVFPTLEDALDWCFATTDDEVLAVKFVLAKFFQFIDGVYVDKKIVLDIEKWRKRGWFPSLVDSLRPSIDEWKATRLRIFKRDNYTCKYCLKVGGVLECDHMNPITLGGSNGDENLTTSCKKCNRAKSNLPFDLWMLKIGGVN